MAWHTYLDLRPQALYPGDVGRVDVIPSIDVLLHAIGEAGLLAARDRRAGLRDAALEAVLVEFLWAGRKKKKKV